MILTNRGYIVQDFVAYKYNEIKNGILREINKILNLLDKRNEIFKDFFNFIENIKLENNNNIKAEIIEKIKYIKIKYEEKLINEKQENLENEIKLILNTKKDIDFDKYNLSFSEFNKVEEENYTRKSFYNRFAIYRRFSKRICRYI